MDRRIVQILCLRCKNLIYVFAASKHKISLETFFSDRYPVSKDVEWILACKGFIFSETKQTHFGNIILGRWRVVWKDIKWILGREEIFLFEFFKCILTLVELDFIFLFLKVFIFLLISV